MRRKLHFLLCLAIALFSLNIIELKAEKKPPGRPCRWLTPVSPKGYSEILNMAGYWETGLKKKQIKQIRAGWNPIDWPRALSNADNIVSNSFNLSRLKMYEVNTFLYADFEYSIVCVPAAENGEMPAELRPTRDIFFCVSTNTLDRTRFYNPEIDGAITRYFSIDEFYPGKYLPCRILDASAISSLDLVDNQKLWQHLVNPYLKSEILAFSPMAYRPDFFRSEDELILYNDRLPFYYCYQVAEFEVDGEKYGLVEITDTDNEHMPSKMIPAQTFYMPVKLSGLDRTRTWDPELDGYPENKEEDADENVEAPPVLDAQNSFDVKIEPGVEVECYIVDRGELYSESGIEEFIDELSVQLPNVDEVAANIVQTAWPEGISTLDKREANNGYFIDYKANAIARLESGGSVFYILKINPDDNTHMPAEMIPSQTIYFLIGSAGLSLDKTPKDMEGEDSDIRPGFAPGYTDPVVIKNPDINAISIVPGGKTKVYIVNRGKLYSTYNPRDYSAELEKYMGAKYYDVLKYAHEDNWPSGISTLENREKRNKEFLNYNVNTVALFEGKMYVLEVLPEENKHQPVDMQSNKPFYFIFERDGISTDKP